MPKFNTLGIFLLLAFLVTVAAYYPALNGDPVWDDNFYIFENQAVTEWEGIIDIWFHPKSLPNPYPLTFTSFWVEYQSGLSQKGIHADNLLLHLLVTLLLFLLLYLLKIPGAPVAAGLFALHPVHVESVAWMAERKDVLSGVFFLLALITWQRVTTTKSILWYQCSLIAVAAALTSKTVTCVLPVVMLWMCYWNGTWNLKKSLQWLWPHFLVSGLMGLVTVWWERSRLGAAGEVFALDPLDRFLIAGRVPWFYLSSVVWPFNLAPIYPKWDINPTIWWQWLFPVATLLAVTLAWQTRKAWGGWGWRAVGLYLVVLFPALGVFNHSTMHLSFVADHYQYLASAVSLTVIAVMIRQLCYWLKERAPIGALAAPALAVTVLTSWGTITFQQATTFSGPGALWQHAHHQNPESWVPLNNLGIYYLESGQYAKAVSCFQAALTRKPELGRLAVNLAIAQRHAGEDAAAEETLRSLRASGSVEPGVYYALGRYYQTFGDLKKASEAYLDTVIMDPKFPEAWNSLGVAWAQTDRLSEAVQAFIYGLSHHPGNQRLQRNLEMAFSDLKAELGLNQNGLLSSPNSGPELPQN